MLKVAAVVLAIPASLLAVVLGTGVVVVDVSEPGTRIVLPVPLLLAEVAAKAAPKDKVKIDLKEAREELAKMGPLLQAIDDCPDGVLVEVEKQEEHVSIAKAGRLLQVRVKDQGEEVSVDLPVSAIQEIFGHGEDLDLSRIVSALRKARMTRLVNVQKGDEHVRISVF
jgi:hypothetical protein